MKLSPDEIERLQRTINEVSRMARRHSRDHDTTVHDEILKLYRALNRILPQ